MTEKQKNLEALKAELAEIESKLAEVPKLQQRCKELRGAWHDKGEIWHAQMAIRDEAFPIWRDNDYWKTRIIEISDKWIIMREDRAEPDKVSRYRRSDGQKERTRNQWDKIDTERVVQIWEDHQSALTTP